MKLGNPIAGNVGNVPHSLYAVNTSVAVLDVVSGVYFILRQYIPVLFGNTESLLLRFSARYNAPILLCSPHVLTNMCQNTPGNSS